MNPEIAVFNAIVIDTNAFDAKGNDFCGYFDPILPSFFKSIHQQKLQLISHPILQGETVQHIRDGDLNNKPSYTDTAIQKHKAILELIGISCDEIREKLRNLDLCESTVKSFLQECSTATMLPYTDAAVIFEQYFSSTPPFAKSGDKKSEFPDAFVIESLKLYLRENPNISVLVVSNDGDWKNSLAEFTNVTLADNINEALQLIHSCGEKLTKIIDCLNEEIVAMLASCTDDIWFNLPNYECDDDPIIDSVVVDAIDDFNVVPLSITSDAIVLQTTASLLVNGEAIIFDPDNSVWDGEERVYILPAYSKMIFKEAEAEVTCQLTISLDNSQQPTLENVKLIQPSSVELSIDEDKTDYEDPIDENDIRGEMLDALEEYYRH